MRYLLPLLLSLSAFSAYAETPVGAEHSAEKSSKKKPAGKKDEPAKKPAAKPAQKPAAKPAAKPAPKPAPRPESKPAPAPEHKSQPASQPSPSKSSPTSPSKSSPTSPSHSPASPSPAHGGNNNARPVGEHGAGGTPVSRPPPADTVHEPARRRPEVRDAPRSTERHKPAYHTTDHRYAHPAAHHVRAYPAAHHPPPHHGWYRPWYTHWYVHPYYRWVAVTTAFVYFDYHPYAWTAAWAPPGRAGWVWVPGHWEGPFFAPGHWVPYGPAPVVYGRSWAYVPGWWVGDYYVEGYYRADSRGDDWVWDEGHYRSDGSYAWGHWEPRNTAPDGYVWEAGFWDGESWAEGFWRPEGRDGYRWVTAAYDTDGVYHGGYWEPMEDRPGHVWIPGWFDGHAWVEGYWVTDAEYNEANAKDYQPEEGWNDGWEDKADAAPAEGEDAPLAIPAPE